MSHQLLCTHIDLYLGQENSEDTTHDRWTEESMHQQTITVLYYLDKKYNEEVEVGYSSELLEQVLWDKIPNCVLKEKRKKTAEVLY